MELAHYTDARKRCILHPLLVTRRDPVYYLFFCAASAHDEFEVAGLRRYSVWATLRRARGGSVYAGTGAREMDPALQRLMLLYLNGNGGSTAHLSFTHSFFHPVSGFCCFCMPTHCAFTATRVHDGK